MRLTKRMYDAACLSEPAALQRAVGELLVSFRSRDGATVLDELRQVGCLKARFPRSGAIGWAEVVTLNSSGGIAGGDRLGSRFRVQPEAQAVIAAQAAERFYRALPGSEPARVRTTIEVAYGAAAEWLPQETILFDCCALDRCLDIELADDARFIGVEMLVFGRTAMGETVIRGSIRDRIRIRRSGRLVLQDTTRLHGEVAARLQRPAIAGRARAMALLMHAAADAETRLDTVRTALAGTEAGVSAWNGLLLARILAPDSAKLRHAVVSALAALRGARALPRVWTI
jgi:urease accessory protein